MKSINFKRFRNKYLYITILLLFVLLHVSYIFENGVIYNLFFREDYGSLTKAEGRKLFLDQIFVWEISISECQLFYRTIFPIMAVIVAIPFWEELNTYFAIAANKFSNRRRELLKSVLSYGIMGGMSIFFGFFIYFASQYYFMIPSITDLGGYLSILPENFYAYHPFITIVFILITMYFPIGFLFGVMTCGVLLCTRERITAILFPMFIYVVGSYIGEIFNLSILNIRLCTSVWCTLTPFQENFIPLISVVIIDIILLVVGVKKNEKVIC